MPLQDANPTPSFGGLGLRQEGIETSRENIAKLTEMSGALEQKVKGLLQKGDSRPGSIDE